MIDGDDRVSQGYRRLAREEPPAALDLAILDASRRAVGPRRARDWGVPVSIAAVVMLAAGLTFHMQREEPGIELQEPGARGAPPPAAQSVPAPEPAKETQSAQERERTPVPESARAPAAAAPQATLSAKEEVPKPQPKLSRLQKTAPETPTPVQQAPVPFPDASTARGDANVATEARPATRAESFTTPARTEPPPPAPMVRIAPAAPSASAPAPAEVPMTAPAQAQLGRAAQAPTAASPRAPAPARADAAAGASSDMRSMAEPTLRAKREAAADALSSEAKPVDELQRELERIARLRAEGRDAEADKALEEFRRKHPDYRIPSAMWERVKPR